MKEILSGNEAIARGAYEAGCLVASAYPVPFAEILENVINTKIQRLVGPPMRRCLRSRLAPPLAVPCAGLHEACRGQRSCRSAVTASYTVSRAGWCWWLPMIRKCILPERKDSRNYAKFAKVPMLEPADSRECKEFTGWPLKLSEQFDTR